MKTGLIFSGQGAQAVGMGKSFYEASPIVRGMYDLAHSVLGYDLKKVCFEGPAEELTQTKVCQPALYVHGFAAWTLLKDAMPVAEVAAVAGLSLGELTALAAADVFDFATGLRVVAMRGRLMQEACESTNGTMASVIGGSRAQVTELCAAYDIDMANLNCPGQIVISGEKSKVQAAVAAGAGMGFKKIIPLNVAGAYHSRLMQGAADKFAKFLQDVNFKAPKFAVFTNTTGQQVKTPEEIKAALVKQVTHSVLWEDCFRNAAALGVEQFYECGVGGVLTGLAKRIEPNAKVSAIATIQELQAATSAAVGA